MLVPSSRSHSISSEFTTSPIAMERLIGHSSVAYGRPSGWRPRYWGVNCSGNSTRAPMISRAWLLERISAPVLASLMVTPEGICSSTARNIFSFRLTASVARFCSVISSTTTPKPVISPMLSFIGYQLSFQYRFTPGADAFSVLNS